MTWRTNSRRLESQKHVIPGGKLMEIKGLFRLFMWHLYLCLTLALTLSNTILLHFICGVRFVLRKISNCSSRLHWTTRTTWNPNNLRGNRISKSASFLSQHFSVNVRRRPKWQPCEMHVTLSIYSPTNETLKMGVECFLLWDVINVTYQFILSFALYKLKIQTNPGTFWATTGFCSEDDDSTFLRNVRNHIPNFHDLGGYNLNLHFWKLQISYKYKTACNIEVVYGKWKTVGVCTTGNC
jgi:hypothetical protein